MLRSCCMDSEEAHQPKYLVKWRFLESVTARSPVIAGRSFQLTRKAGETGWQGTVPIQNLSVRKRTAYSLRLRSREIAMPQRLLK